MEGGFRNDVEYVSVGAVDNSGLMVYLMLVTVLAVILWGRQKDTRSYFLASDCTQCLAVSLSLSASLFSALTYLGVPAFVLEENASIFLDSDILLGPLLVGSSGNSPPKIELSG